MTATRKQIEEQLEKAFEEIKKLYVMAEDAKIEAEDEDDECDLAVLCYDVACVTFPMYMDDTYFEIEMAAEGLENSWKVDGWKDVYRGGC